jgi:lysophospholipase L1-like esterase
MTTAQKLAFDLFDSTGTVREALSPVLTWEANSQHTVTACSNNGLVSVYGDGVLLASATTGGTGLQTSIGATLYVGGVTSGIRQWTGNVRNLIVCSGTGNPSGCVPNSSALTYKSGASLGDSMTASGTPPYTTTVRTTLGWPYQWSNYGVSGYTAAQSMEKWSTEAVPFRHAIVTVLVGVNNLNLAACQTSACTIAELTALYASIRASGARLIPLTILPYKNYVSWNSTRETARQEINTWILAYCTANSLTCVDTATDFNDGAGALKGIYDSGDGLHPNQAGIDRIAALIVASSP